MKDRIWMCLPLLCLAAAPLRGAEPLVFDDTAPGVRLTERATRAAAPGALGGTAAVVDGSWSVRWSIDRAKVQPDVWYDLYLRHKGRCSVTLYHRQDGYRIGFRELAAGNAGWTTTWIGRKQLGGDDYLAFSGNAKDGGMIDQLILKPYALSPKEKELRERKALQGFRMLTGGEQSFTLSGMFREPLKLDYFADGAFAAELEYADGATGRRDFPAGAGSCEISASEAKALRKISFAVQPAAGALQSVVVDLRNPVSARFLPRDYRSQGASSKTFDELIVGDGLRDAFRAAKFLEERQALFQNRKEDWIFRPVSSLHKVFPDLLPEDGRIPTRISLAKNEFESVQLVGTPRPGVTPGRFRVAWVPDKGAEALQVEFRKIGFVNTPRRAYRQLVAAGHRYPDPLLPLADGVWEADHGNQAIWCTVYAPADIAPGDYRGTVTVTGEGETVLANVPFSVRVRSFAIPEVPTVKSCFFLNRRWLVEYYGLKSWDEEKAVYLAVADLAARYRLTPMPMIETRPKLPPLWRAWREKDGSITYDFSRQNELVKAILDKNHGCGYNITASPKYAMQYGYMLVTDRETGKEVRLNYPVLSPEYKKIYRGFLQAAWKNAVDHGWQDKAWHYIWDEWKGSQWNELHEISHEVAPELKVIAVGYDPKSMTPGARDAVDIFVPLTSDYDKTFAEQAARDQKELWTYVCCSPKAPALNLYIDQQSIDHRALAWQMAAQNVNGFLYWGLTYWADAAAKARQGKRWPAEEWQANQFTDINGDGYLAYPAPDRSIWPSLRLEILRDGMEDLEYIALLRQALPRMTPEQKAKAQVLLKRLGDPVAPKTRQTLPELRDAIGDLLEQTPVR